MPPAGSICSHCIAFGVGARKVCWPDGYNIFTGHGYLKFLREPLLDELKFLIELNASKLKTAMNSTRLDVNLAALG